VAEHAPAVCDVLATIESRDWPRLERLLDAEVHWTTAVEEHLLNRWRYGYRLRTRRPISWSRG